jgi:transposase-like protein
MAKKADKKFQTETKYNRSFSEEFRKTKVKEITSGHLKVGDMCRLYDISRTTVYKWLYLYSEVEKGVKTVIQMESEATKTKLLQQRLAEMERVVGQKQLEIDYLNVCLEVASKEVGYDLKKKYAPPRWNIFEEAKIKNQSE